MRVRNLLVLASALGGAFAYRRFRAEMSEIRAQLADGSTVADTAAGPIEFAEQGEGTPLLLIHGAGGGYDQGLLIGRDLGRGFRVIAPSRFGYLRTPEPADASAAAQAAAHVALLDHLGVRQAVVMGVSAGAPSALALALAHPERVTALILLVPALHHPDHPVGVEQSAVSAFLLRMLEAGSDFAYWLAIRAARPAVLRLFGTPATLDIVASPEERQRVTDYLRALLPPSLRQAGMRIDTQNPPADVPLAQVSVPTLIVSAEDDLFNTLPAARFAARRIPGAELRILAQGGHLTIGQGEQVRAWIKRFLAGHAPARRPPKAVRVREVEHA